MELLIRQRVFSWTDTYDVYDAQGNPKYFVKSDFLSLGHTIHIYSHATGQEVGCIRQRILTFLPKFEIWVNGSCAGFVCKEFTLLRPRYRLDYLGWQVQGDLMGWDYQVTRGGAPVLTISKELFRWSDTYVLRFASPADELQGLLLVIAIDAANCSQSRH